MKKPNVLVVSHDAGGANILLKWCLEYQNRCAFQYCLRGPALNLYHAMNLHGPLVKYFKDVKPDYVITSTGWQTDFEKNAILYAKNNFIKVASYLDHWVNYKSRFEVSGMTILPDEIWTHDSESKKIAFKQFSKDVGKIRFIKDRHFKELKKNVLAQYKITNNRNNVLICLEPIRQDIDVLSCYKILVSYLKNNYFDNKIIIRDHPSSCDTYMGNLVELLKPNFNVVVSQQDLDSDLAISKVVFGYQSSVLIYALKLKLKAISYYPSDKLKPQLPHGEILYIS